MERKFTKWLSFAVTEVNREKNRNLRLQEGSPPTWIFALPEFETWLAGSSNVLWLSGTTGFGKSVLAAYIADELPKRVSPAPVSFFFCKDLAPLREAHYIMRTFLYHLTIRSPVIREALQSLWEQTKESKDLDDISDIRTLFKSIVAQLLGRAFEDEKIYFIIDGMNECQQRQRKSILEFLSFLLHFQFIRVLVICQPTVDITVCLSSAVRVELNQAHNSATIAAYVASQIKSVPELANRFHHVDKEPVEFFRRNHKGMFLWVSSVLALLRWTVSDLDFQNVLRDVPETLSGVYQQSLDRVTKDLSRGEREWVKILFCWTVLAKRDLSVSELKVGIPITYKIKHKLLQCPTWLDTMERVLSRCGAFIHITRVDRETGEQTVSIVHETFRLFITNTDECTSEFLVDVHEGNALIAKSCLFYLSDEAIPRYDQIYLPSQLRRVLSRNHALFSYATQYWSTHVRKTHSGRAKDIRELRDVMAQFFRYETILTWLQSVFTYATRSAPYPIPLPGTLIDVGEWCRKENIRLLLKKITSSIETTQEEKYRTSDMRDLFDLFKNAASEIWLTGDPKYRTEAIVSFSVLQDITIAAGINPHLGNRESVEVLADRFTFSEKGARWHANVGHAYSAETSNLNALRSAIHHYQTSLQLGACLNELTVSFELTKVLHKVAEIDERQTDLDAAIKMARNTIQLGRGEANLFEYMNELSALLCVSFIQNKALESLDESIELGQKTLDLAPPDYPSRFMYSTTLATGLVLRFEWKGGIVDIEESIKLRRAVLGMALPNKIRNCFAAESLAATLQTGYRGTGRREYLDESISVYHSIKQSFQEDLPWAAQLANNLSASLLSSYKSSHSRQDLEESIVLARKAIELTPLNETKTIYAMHANNLSVALRVQAETEESLQDRLTLLNESVELATVGFRSTPTEHKQFANHANNLAVSLGQRFNETGNMDDLDNAILMGQIAFESSSEGHISRAGIASSISSNLRTRFVHSGSPKDGTESILFGRKAVEHADLSCPLRAMCANTLGLALSDQVGIETLNESLLWHREALKLTPPGHPDLPMYWNNMCSRLSSRVEEGEGNSQDLDEAINFGRRALNMTSKGPNIPMFCNNLASALQCRGEQKGKGLKDLDDAIMLLRKAVALTSEKRPGFRMYLNNLARALFARSIRKKDRGDGDLRDAIQTWAKTVEATPSDHRDLAMHKDNLATGLLERYRRERHYYDLDQALELVLKAYEVTPVYCTDEKARYQRNIDTIVSIKYSLRLRH
jgi:tetratricopeptide (TPR) repeat protein